MELCIDFGGTEIKLAVIDGERTLASDSLPAARAVADLDATRAAAEALLARLGARPTGVGVAVPGVVDPISGRMRHANDKYEFLTDFDLHDWATARFGAPVAVENDARAALIGETTSGSARGERDVVLLTLGTGIGTAAMIDGTALRGAGGHAGILGGHVTIDLHGPICPCGNVGCGEALASARALSTGTVKDLFESSGHTRTRDDFLQVWGATVVTLCHMFDPTVVVLSGGVLRAGDGVRAPIEAYVRAHLWPSMTPPRFVVPPEPEFSVARGLSELARQPHHPTATHQENQ